MAQITELKTETLQKSKMYNLMKDKTNKNKECKKCDKCVHCMYPNCECHTQAPQEEKECKHKFIDADKCKGCNEVFEDIWKAPQEEKGCEHDSGIFGKKHCGICQNTPQKKDTSWLERFYNLYEYGRKKEKAPQNFIDYFKARGFLYEEIQKTKEETIKEVIEKIDGMYKEAKNVREFMKPCEYNEALQDLKTLLTKE